jgi:nicotinate-nucleotide pyrophosphorylase (carboxylating)
MDIRAFLFEPLEQKIFSARLTAAQSGILAGAGSAVHRASSLGLIVLSSLPDGSRLFPGCVALHVRGTAEQMARGEEELLACVGKASGVATAASCFTAVARERARIVCGAWKKVSPDLRKELRQAIATGGAGMRLVDDPFVYLDKNFVRMFSGVAEAVRRACLMNGRVVVVQIRGDTAPIGEEACVAYDAGAGVLMVDTGKVEDLRAVVDMALRRGFRDRVRIAFGGGVTCDRLEVVITAGADAIDIGRAVIDAPLLDFRFDVEA